MATEMKTDEIESLVRVGIVGGGFIGRTVGKQFRADDNASVAALVDIDEEVLRLDSPCPLGGYMGGPTMRNGQLRYERAW